MDTTYQPWTLCDSHAHQPWAHAILAWQASKGRSTSQLTLALTLTLHPHPHLHPGKQGTLDISASLPASADASSTHHVAFRSPQQLRAFNAPFQLGRASPRSEPAPIVRSEPPSVDR